MWRNAAVYSKCHDAQTRYAKELISKICPSLKWSEKPELVADIGCGSGDTTAQLLLPALTNVERVIAFDVEPNMVDFAKKNNSHPKIQYYLADIQDWSKFSQWEGQLSKVFSFYCLHWVKNQRLAIQNIHKLLRDGGEAIIAMVLTRSSWKNLPQLLEKPKWSKYLKKGEHYLLESEVNGHDGSYYRHMFADLGFQVQLCLEEESKVVYNLGGEYRDVLTGRCLALKDIPENLHQEFKDDLYEMFKESQDYEIETNLFNVTYGGLIIHLIK